MDRKEMKKLCIRTAKIAVGSSAAIYVAEALNLEYAAAAGSIALLTIVTTKWETLKLSVLRVLTFLAAVALAWVTFVHISSEWTAYGVFIFIMVLLSELVGLKATISVNAVIGTHFLTTMDFGMKFIRNEFLLVLIGISVAIILNLYHDNHNQKKDLIRNMRWTEQQLQMILREMASYLFCQEMERNVWDDICNLEKQLHGFISDAYEYQNNTFQSHPGYYIDYFEMRMKQCNVLHNLHYEMKKIRTMPVQAEIIAQYILYLVDYVIEINIPQPQIERLNQIFREMEQEPLPVSRAEFESRAMLYHILMDLEEFLVFKKRFVNELDEGKLKRYWN
ncbi:aromatic acid exporter family protein [Blautia sp. HCP3S3_G3]|uniref:aromatic acid exporter family protein n=1 Tax=Blautia sp. HCP3S3_G3 TaxID=3438913 RepID=UPI003F8CA8FF